MIMRSMRILRFRKDSRLLLIGRDVSTRYTQRKAGDVPETVSYIVVQQMRKREIMCSFRPYRVMEEVHSVFSKSAEKFLLLFQSPFMSKKSRGVS